MCRMHVVCLLMITVPTPPMSTCRYTKEGRDKIPTYNPTVDPSAIPVFVDWRLQGAVTRVKDQGICGSCWSFGSAETLEGSYFIKVGGAGGVVVLHQGGWGRGRILLIKVGGAGGGILLRQGGWDGGGILLDQGGWGRGRDPT